MCDMADNEFTIKSVNTDLEKEIIDFLTKFFFLEEPLNIDVGLSSDYTSGKRCSDLENYCISSLSEGISVGAFTASNNLVGVLLNSMVRRDDTVPKYKITDQRLKKIVDFLNYADRKLDLFSIEPDLDAFIEMRIVAVNSMYRGRNIAQKMTEFTINLCKKLNVKYVKTPCTSFYSARMAEKVGLEKIFEVKYSEYQDENNRRVFNPPLPHESLKVLAMKLC